MAQVVRPQPGIMYPPQQQAPAIQQHLSGNPGNDPYARLNWLETQHQALFKDNAWLFNDTLRLNNEKARLVQEHERLQRQNVELLAEKQQLSNARSPQQSQLLTEQNAWLLAENRRLAEEKDRIALENRELRGTQSSANSEDLKALVEKLKDEVATLKKEADDNSLAYVFCGKCQYSNVIKNTLCSGCFMPAYDCLGGGSKGRKGSTKISRYQSVSDSDDEGRPGGRSHCYEDGNTRSDTRLDQDMFDWLQIWCLRNSDEIERRRVLEWKQNEPTVRKLVEDLRHLEDEIRTAHKGLAGQKKRKRQLKRKLIVLVDETPVVATDQTLLKKKLFTFCYVLSQPQQEFDGSRFPKMIGDKLLSEREAVKIFHEMLTAMRVLYRELVELPKEIDKKFKPRKSNPNQWRMLQCPDKDTSGLLREWEKPPPDRLEEMYVSTKEEAQIAATALQNLIHYWNEGLM